MDALAEMTWQGHRGAMSNADWYLHLVDEASGKSLCGYAPRQLRRPTRHESDRRTMCGTCRDKAWS